MLKKELMSSDDVKNMKERVRWAIGYICDNCNMTNEKISREMGCSTSTINSYRRMVTVPGMDFLIYMNKYNFSLEWFTSGKGEPFAGAREKYPEVCDKEKTIDAKEFDADYEQNNNIPLSQVMISDTLEICMRVLKSGTSYANALFFAIRHFNRAAEAESFAKKYRNELDYFKKEFENMKNRLESMEQENMKLHAEIKKIKRSET